MRLVNKCVLNLWQICILDSLANLESEQKDYSTLVNHCYGRRKEFLRMTGLTKTSIHNLTWHRTFTETALSLVHIRRVSQIHTPST
jgi:hypothetical protein